MRTASQFQYSDCLLNLPIHSAHSCILSALFLLFLLLFFQQAQAAEFCVASNQELHQALTVAASNKSDDIIRITSSASDLEGFQLTPETGYMLKVIGGWNKDCSQRESRISHAATKVRTDLPDSYFEPHRSTTGPTLPPAAVDTLSTTQQLSGTSFLSGAQASITGVPAYIWHHGCGPTAVGMIVGYYALNGYDDLVDSSAASQSGDVNQMIASEGSSESPAHYEDYCLPIDDETPSILTDKSAELASERHSDNCVADFMKTSRSAEGLRYGWSWSSDIIPAFTSYAPYRSAAYSVSGTLYYMGTTLTWDVLKAEIDAGRPMAFLVDSDGDGETDHFITVIGYSDSGTQQYACYNTWDSSVHWYTFQGLSSSYTYGVWGGMAFTMTGTTLEEAAHLIWQKQSSGKVAWWKIATTGKIYNSAQATGWDYVSESLTLNSAWSMGGSATIGSTDSLIWQKKTNGKVAYWKLDSNYYLQNETQNDGWAYISDTLTLNSAWTLGGITQVDSQNILFWQKQNNGKVAWWRLGDDGKLANETKDDGWGYVSDELTLDSAWKMAGITEIDGYKSLIWQKQNNGKVAYWKLTANGYRLQNTTQGDGWDYVSDTLTLNSAWRLAAITEIDSQKYLIWQKQSNGKVAYWKLSTTGKLPNETQDDGWGYVSDDLTLNSAWSLGGIANIDSLPMLIWHKQTTGKVAYWKLTYSCKLQDSTQNSGWGYISDSLTLDSSWRLVDVMQ